MRRASGAQEGDEARDSHAFRQRWMQRLAMMRSMTRVPGPSTRGSGPEEQARLTRMQGLLNRRSMQALALEPGQRVLELGAGLGHLACLMAREVGAAGQVVGIEVERHQHDLSRRRASAECPQATRPDMRRGHAVDPPLLPEEWGSFDVAHARFLLEHVRHPEEVVEAMLRAVRPGGRIVLEDNDRADLRLWPEAPAVMTLWQAYMELFTVLGHDPRVGRDLVRLAVRAGAQPQRADCLSFSGCSGDARFTVLHEDFLGMLRGARAAIADCGLLPPADIDAGIRSFEEWGRRPDAALWYATCWVQAVRPAAP